MKPKPIFNATARLTPREKTVAALVCVGDKAAADALAISVATYRCHLRHVRKKLGVTSRAGVLLALVLSPDCPMAIRTR